MRKVSVGLVIAVVAGMLALALLGCGGSPADGAAEAPPTEPPAAEAPAEEAPVEPTAAEETPAEEAPFGAWTTIATLKSTDPKDDMGFLVSKEFTVDGDVQVVLRMPGARKTDAVIFAFLPAGEPITVRSASEAESVVLGGPMLRDVVSGLSGDFVLLATTAAQKAWQVKVQTKH